MRLLVSLVALLVAAGPAAPVFARMIGGPPVHACHCDARGGHAHCACPICFPELVETDVPAIDPTTQIATGICGDDDPAWRTLAVPAVPAVGFSLAPVIRSVAAAPSTNDLSTQWTDSPDPRPPRPAFG